MNYDLDFGKIGCYEMFDFFGDLPWIYVFVGKLL
jgi:hypothetical protein